MKKPNTILAAINMSVFDNEVIKRAVLIANRTNSQLHFIYTVDISLIDIEISSKFMKQKIDENRIKKEVVQKINDIERSKEVEYFVHIRVGDAKGQVIHLSQKIRADLIILGLNSKKSVEEYYFGSTANIFSKKTTLPILVVNSKIDGVYKKILVPTDLSVQSKETILFLKTVFKHSAIKLVFAYKELDDLTVEYSEVASNEDDNEHIFLGHSHISIFKEDVGIDKIEMLKSSLPTHESLLEYIKKTDSDLVILSSTGSDVIGSYLNSTTYFLLRNIHSDRLLINQSG